MSRLGLEPRTLSLKGRCSTTELPARERVRGEPLAHARPIVSQGRDGVKPTLPLRARRERAHTERVPAGTHLTKRNHYDRKRAKVERRRAGVRHQQPEGNASSAPDA